MQKREDGGETRERKERGHREQSIMGKEGKGKDRGHPGAEKGRSSWGEEGGFGRHSEA